MTSPLAPAGDRAPLPTLRPLSGGEILDTAFGIYRRLWPVLAGIQLACLALPFLLDVYLAGAGGYLAQPAVAVVYIAASVVLTGIAVAATVVAISDTYLGRMPRVGDALARAAGLLWRVIALSMLTTLVIMIGFILLLVPGVILLSGLLVGPQALVLEPDRRAIDAMGRSWTLTRDFRLRGLGLVVVGTIIVFIPVLAVGAIAGVMLGPEPESSIFPVVATTVGWLVQMLVYPILYCLLTVMYYDLRVRKEGFDLELLSAALADG